MDATPSAKELFCKTRLCKFYAVGRCKQGKRCTFAHGDRNVAPKPDFYRTRMCPSLIDKGSCSLGHRCAHAHSKQELRSSVTKSSSNAANQARGNHVRHDMMTSGVIKESNAARLYDQMNEPTGLVRCGRRTNLQEMLDKYGVPEAPARPAKSQPVQEQSHMWRIVDPHVEHGDIHPPARFATTSKTTGNHEIRERKEVLSATSSCRSEAALTADLCWLLQDPTVSRFLAAKELPNFGESHTRTQPELLQTDAKLIFDGQQFGQTFLGPPSSRGLATHLMCISGGHQKDVLPSLEDVEEAGVYKENV